MRPSRRRERPGGIPGRAGRRRRQWPLPGAGCRKRCAHERCALLEPPAQSRHDGSPVRSGPDRPLQWPGRSDPGGPGAGGRETRAGARDRGHQHALRPRHGRRPRPAGLRHAEPGRSRRGRGVRAPHSPRPGDLRPHRTVADADQSTGPAPVAGATRRRDLGDLRAPPGALGLDQSATDRRDRGRALPVRSDPALRPEDAGLVLGLDGRAPAPASPAPQRGRSGVAPGRAPGRRGRSPRPSTGHTRRHRRRRHPVRPARRRGVDGRRAGRRGRYDGARVPRARPAHRRPTGPALDRPSPGRRDLAAGE
jgi:hypothetical protein